MRPETVLKNVVRIEKVTHERQVNSRQYRIEKSVRREELDERREEKEKEKIPRDRWWQSRAKHGLTTVRIIWSHNILIFHTPKVMIKVLQHCLILYLFVGTFSNTFPLLLGIYVTFGLPDSDCTIALLASIFLRATKASPAFSSAREIVAAASASPSARMTAACLSCSAYSTSLSQDPGFNLGVLPSQRWI